MAIGFSAAAAPHSRSASVGFTACNVAAVREPCAPGGRPARLALQGPPLIPSVLVTTPLWSWELAFERGTLRWVPGIHAIHQRGAFMLYAVITAIKDRSTTLLWVSPASYFFLPLLFLRLAYPQQWNYLWPTYSFLYPPSNLLQLFCSLLPFDWPLHVVM